MIDDKARQRDMRSKSLSRFGQGALEVANAMKHVGCRAQSTAVYSTARAPHLWAIHLQVSALQIHLS